MKKPFKLHYLIVSDDIEVAKDFKILRNQGMEKGKFFIGYGQNLKIKPKTIWIKGGK